MAETEQPIIIKKIKKGGHGHHGGAWKVAYADFVTAMMAFFLLLWLLSATDQETKEGIADYFTPTIGLRDSQGIGFDGGIRPTEDGTKKEELSPMGIVVGKQPQGPIPDKPEKEALIEGESEAKLFEKAEAQIKKALEEDPTLREFKDQIIVEQTPEGLKIEFLDLDKSPMFKPGGVELTLFGEKMLKRMSDLIVIMPNYVSVTGHTDSTANSNPKYTNWELSADRANAARRFFLTTKMEPGRVAKVVGMADRELRVKDDPKSPRNRRISVILLKGSHMNIDDSMLPGSRSILRYTPQTDLNKPLITLDPDSGKTTKTAPVIKPEEKPDASLLPPTTGPASVPASTPQTGSKPAGDDFKLGR